MRDPGFPSHRLRAAAPLRLGASTVLPIERVAVWSGRAAAGAWVSGAVEPYAVVVRGPDGARLVALAASAVTLEELRARVPEVDALLA